ncbi:2-succinyl-5-enolpyruvyl-6-hydroxy-3-cyclohexene-1-carboxylic-acid synthase [Prodigiosinella confusarubida]|uniref:2-succinyl-5-enolpyruvyl-6-hydroxy-3-cyclohexene-1-carboxylate synthase n=1 Tax=Serratia sp. (strain ATCC 39006) TaxID=104623 RepID=A0A2I5TN32_SERS3|nr:2-succinyl-5-enolpyruvyl-6-hydroxy-3-cyclohexene-1-carboxylic-acid synthase [Serratia sp. ATCC 39006]AUH01648.1 2-succinyl-5-enolpyruvyl-6-hydroxy-3-cyclohexene-1-carboxylic-acid synthase [Serratia sp. ATCC 39006]AUH05971.1 2-succinyl-5-enolpyruvyl-6-hydroxy-3-cyclohexene-1-carboxylic-acid synthase [Serratia sp. ATCC 39006]
MSTNVFNHRWASVLFEALTRHGVHHVCIAPGSRSTPLTLAAANHPALICHTHFDERGLGHLALGLAKAGREPVAIVVTSGTAAANLYPAVIEAGLTGERLVVLTADRPPELIDCGANQAIRQAGMFASHPQQTLSLPRPTPDISARWLVSAVDNALTSLSYGAVHINCPFAEPLYGADDPDIYQDWLQTLGDWWRDGSPWLRADTAPAGCIMQPDWLSWQKKRGVVIVGRVPAEQGEKIAHWAQQLGWPLIGDVLSQSGQPLPCADLWLAHPQAAILQQAELVVQFGGSLTGKRLLQWQAASQPLEYWLVDPLSGRLDPAQHRGRRLVADIGVWLTAHPSSAQAPWAKALDDCVGRVHQQVVSRLTFGFGEAQLAHRVPELLPTDGQFFVGNSLTVRLVDALAQLPAGYPVYSNRGASGIDGLISTLAGVQRANGRPTLGIIGDLSALYDLNALALLRQVPASLVLIVVNNNGGQIFSLLPTPPEQREMFYCMPQQVEFGHAAAMFGLRYVRAENWQQVEDAVTQGWQQCDTTLLEVVVTPKAGAETLSQLLSEVASW